MAEVEVVTSINEERHFVSLFHEVLESIRGNLSDEDISDGARTARNSFRGGPGNACDIGHYDAFNVSCGFFYRYPPLSAGLTRKKASDAIRDCGEFRSCLKHPSLKIISFGCGSGSDLVGLLSALYDEAELQELSLTLVDSNEGWEDFFQMVEHSLRAGNFGNASRFFQSTKVTTRFIYSDMLDENITDYKEDLKAANVVWTKGFLSVLDSNFQRFQVTKLVVSSMTPRALLVVIDSPSYDNFGMFSNDIERVYSTNTTGYSFQQTPIKYYDPGLCNFSNQELFAFVKK